MDETGWRAQLLLEQLSELNRITYRVMMGEYIIYHDGKVVGGIYDDRFLVKPTKSATEMMPDANLELPYEGAKEKEVSKSALLEWGKYDG